MSFMVTILKTMLDLLLLYTLFMAATTAPSLSSAAVITTGISSPVLATSDLRGDSMEKSGSKGCNTPGNASVE